MTEKQLKFTSHIKANIKFKGNSEFNYLIADVFWFNLKQTSFLYKNRNKITTFFSSKVSLTITDFNIEDYFRFK